MKAIRLAKQDFKFVKNQTIFLTEVEFFITVRKMKVLEVINNHEYEAYDDWDGEYFWTSGKALKVLENGHEEIVLLNELDCNTFVSTSSRDALKLVKSFSNMTEHFNLQTKSYFGTQWT